MPVLTASITAVLRNQAGSGAFARRFSQQPLAVYEQDDATILVALYDAGGVPVDMSGGGFLEITLRAPQPTDPAAPPAVTRAWTASDAVNGKGSFDIQGNDTKILNTPGTYEYDVVMIDAGGKRTHVVPVSDFVVLDSASDDGVAAVPAPLAGLAEIRVIVNFSNQSSVTQSFTPFSGTPTLEAQAGMPFINSGSDFPGDIGVTALSNGSITIAAGAAWSGYVVVTIIRTG